MSKLRVYLDNTEMLSFDLKDKIESLVDSLSSLTPEEIKDLDFKVDKDISESIKEDVPNKEYTIWSSTDIAEAGEQIPLVKVKVNDEGELEAEAVDTDDFAMRDLKTAQDSLKTTVGRPLRDRLLRIDKSLNHSDPYFSTELIRQNIIANRGREKKSVIDDRDYKYSDILPEDRANFEVIAKELKNLPQDIKDVILGFDIDINAADLKSTKYAVKRIIDALSDKEYTKFNDVYKGLSSKEQEDVVDALRNIPDILEKYDEDLASGLEQRLDKIDSKFSEQGLAMLANQILITNRDDMKLLADKKTTTEEDLVDLFEELTGVDYYTEKITNNDQYEYLLELLGKPTNRYDEDYESPDENEYIQRFKDLTENLIEKVLLRENPEYYNK